MLSAVELLSATLYEKMKNDIIPRRLDYISTHVLSPPASNQSSSVPTPDPNRFGPTIPVQGNWKNALIMGEFGYCREGLCR